MNTVAKLTQKQIEKLAVEIRTFLLEHDMWVDTQIYFNGKCFDTHDKETGEFYYNDPEHLVVRENEDPNGEIAWCPHCAGYVQTYDEEIEKCPVCGTELED